MKRRLITIFVCLICLQMQAVQLPDWFFSPTKDTYVGISVPGGTPMDAISMALMQYVLANDIPCNFGKSGMRQGNFTIANNSDYQDCGKNLISFDSLKVYYKLLDMNLLPSGEYVCRIKDAGDTRCIISLNMLRETSTAYIDNNESSYSDILVMKYTSDAFYLLEFSSELKRKQGEVIEDMIEVVSADRLNRSSACKGTHQPASNTVRYECSRISAGTSGKAYTQLVDLRNPLALELMDAYMKLLINEAVPAEGSTEEIQIRKATPVVGFSRAENYLILNVEY